MPALPRLSLKMNGLERAADLVKRQIPHGEAITLDEEQMPLMGDHIGQAVGIRAAETGHLPAHPVIMARRIHAINRQ